MQKFLVIILSLFSLLLHGQVEVKVFTPTDLMVLVKNNHPMAKQASLLNKQAKNIVRSARGNFDPYLHSNLDQKYFKDEQYYSIAEGGLKVPTWYGVELQTGMTQNQGVNLNPENKEPEDGLWYGGVKFSLGKGLLMDKRRAELKKAFAYKKAALNERDILLNNLYFEAYQAYWNWASAYQNLKVYQSFYELATERFKGVKESFKYGDKPAIDTLESFIQVQMREVSLLDAQVKYQKSVFELSNFLWNSNEEPLEITDSLRPVDFSTIALPFPMRYDSLEVIINDIAATHPEILQIQNNLTALNVDRRLKLEYLKPQIDLKYNLLSENINNSIPQDYNMEDYKWGFTFKMPLFLREGRGELALAKVKIDNTKLKQQQKTLEISNKIKNFYNQQELIAQQTELLKKTTQNYTRLVSAEKEKFKVGESSLFLINSRESRLIKYQIDLNNLIGYYNIANVGLVWAIGQLSEL